MKTYPEQALSSNEKRGNIHCNECALVQENSFLVLFVATRISNHHVGGKTALAWRGVCHILSFREFIFFRIFKAPTPQIPVSRPKIRGI